MRGARFDLVRAFVRDLPGLDPFHVDVHRARDHDRRDRRRDGRVGRIGAGNEGLGGRASGVDAGSAEELRSTNATLQAGGGQATGKGGTCLSGPDDDGVKDFGSW